MAHTSLNFQRDDNRADFERMRRALKPLADDASVQALVELGGALDTGVARLKRELLASSLIWNDDNHRLMAWIEQQHRAVADFATQLVEAMRPQPGPELPRLIASSLHHRGQAAKWAMGRERAEPRALHALFTLAVACRRHREKFICRVDGGSRRTTIEALYFRALLLDRFSAGNLTRQQVEILDAWLWEWSDDLRGERERPAGASLRVDLDSNAGLRAGTHPADGPSLYLRLDVLERRRRAIVAEMQRGRIVPATGCASELRIEDHVAVLDHLAQAFRVNDDPEAGRAPRTPTSGAQRIEVWAGLPEILSRGIGVGVETGRFRTLSLDPNSASTQSAERFADVGRRYFWMHDVSDTGLGFEALEADADGIEVGDLLGWRRMPGGPVFVGRVTRRFPRGAGEIFFGVSLLSDCPQPLKLEVAGSEGEELTQLFMAGDDASGRHDGFLMLEGCYDVQRIFTVRLAAGDFNIRFNRVRLKGRGWVLAGFELIETLPHYEAAPGGLQAEKPAGGLPQLSLADVDEPDPFAGEVRAKLLD